MANPVAVEDDQEDGSNKNGDDDDKAPVKKAKKAVVELEKPVLKCYDDDSKYLYEIFPEELGHKKKSDALKAPQTVYYNFDPHDKNDPILLALFTTKIKAD